MTTSGTAQQTRIRDCERAGERGGAEAHRRVVGERADDRRDDGLGDSAARRRPREDDELERRGQPDQGQAEVGLRRFDPGDRPDRLHEHDRADRERRHACEHQSELASDPARPRARPRVRFGELGDLPESGRPPLPDPDRRDVRDVERDEQRAGGSAHTAVPRRGRGHDTEREREQRVPPNPGAERQRRDERADRQRHQTHCDVRSDDVAERDCRHLAQRRGDRGRELLGFGPGEQECERECADAEPARGRLEVLGEDLGAHDDERDPPGERREGEDRCHRR